MSKERIIVAGSRDIEDYSLIKVTLDNYIKDSKDFVIVSGVARGVGELGERYAKENGLECVQYLANWDAYGKKASYVRNTEMANNADTLIAFWDVESNGTRNMINIAKKNGLKVFVLTGKGSQILVIKHGYCVTGGQKYLPKYEVRIEN